MLMKKICEDVLDDIEKIEQEPVREETGNPAEGWGYVLIFNAPKDYDQEKTVEFLDSYLSVHADAHRIFPAPEGSVPRGFFGSGDLWVICFEASGRDLLPVYFGILGTCPMAVGRASAREDGRFSLEIPVVPVHVRKVMRGNVMNVADQFSAASEMTILAENVLDYQECLNFLKKFAERKQRWARPKYA